MARIVKVERVRSIRIVAALVLAALIILVFLLTHKATKSIALPVGVLDNLQPVLTAISEKDRTKLFVSPVLPVARNINRKSFATQKDIWSFVQQALKSGDSSDLFEAKTAVSTCAQIVSAHSRIQNFVSGGNHTGISGPLTPSRQLAAAELLSKCDGFINAGMGGTREVAMQLKSALANAPGEHYDISPASTDISPVRIQGLLVSDSAEARTIAGFLAAPLWEKSMGISLDDPRSIEVRQAISLASCDLSADCSAHGTLALQACVFNNLCDQTGTDGWDKALSDEQIRSITAYKNQFEAAVQKQDWQALGIN